MQRQRAGVAAAEESADSLEDGGAAGEARSCSKCAFAGAPRALLAHLRDEHDEDVEIHDCSQCAFAARERGELARHARAAHAAGDSGEARRQHYYSCAKCNYVTHIKSRFTKHVKYHSMPMIKCAACDFRTPYKWNLDRHMKNHGGGGGFCCRTCDFTADIKQSLTVHEMNHHTPPVGQRAGRRRRAGAGRAAAQAAKDQASEDSRSDVSSSNGNPSDTACQAQQSECEAMEVCEDDGEVNSDTQHSFQNVCSALESLRQGRRPRPVPHLIPLNCSTPTQTSEKTSPTEPPLKRFKDMFSGNVDLDILNYSSTDIFKADKLPEDLSVSNASSATNSLTAPRKKIASFFDKLKERLMTESSANGTLTCKSCGFESKCLSEHSVHEKNCTNQPKSVVLNTSSASSLSSTRCQNCRHRCKSSADLYIHMQKCKANVSDENKSEQVITRPVTSQDEDQPHPMENVVFVWNTLSNTEQSKPPTESLNITINDDSSLTEMGPRSYDPNNVDALHDDTEAESLSPCTDGGKRVFKCPHCPFWANTASRFHVHIVGHLNKKPFECSICNYKSNWRWDITKHIKLKSVRDPDHNNAKVLMTDETGRRNYSKYSKYLLTLTEDQLKKSVDQPTYKRHSQGVEMNFDDTDNMSANSNDNYAAPLQMPLDLQISRKDDEDNENLSKKKKTLWKCKKCNYRNPSKEALLEHVHEHTKEPPAETDDANTPKQKEQPSSAKEGEFSTTAYQCGHCNQLSNWKHVIQRHCRLKHNGDIKVMTVERPKTEPVIGSDINTDYCTKCPFQTNDKSLLYQHVQQHTPSPLSIFRCYFCAYFVKTENDLMQHLLLHGITNPEEYVSKAMGCRSTLPEPFSQVKRHKCTDCPYETNSKSQYMYHEQFHRLPANTPYKCHVCNYSVTKRHLLHQHMKVHGVNIKKEPTESDAAPSPSTSPAITTNIPVTVKTEDNTADIPYVWVSAKNEFHKMYKCRYCSYVNSQQCKIPNHEKIHVIWYDNEIKLYKCLECKFTCDNAPRLTEHSKIHGEIYGRIYCEVDTSVPDDVQIAKLRQLLEQEKQALLQASLKKEFSDDKDGDMLGSARILYFCKKCPSRFFAQNELIIHEKFHELKFSIVCKICSFTVPQESQMASHTFVHTDEYQSKTKMLQMMHDTHPSFTQPNIYTITSTRDDPVWVVADNTSANEPHTSKKPESTLRTPKTYACLHCPAKFFKSSALTYHANLHGGPGAHMCRKCDYTVKNIGNLAKHESLHEKDSPSLVDDIKNEFESGDDIDFKNVPLSGTDLFQRKTEAQKRHNSEKLVMRPNDHFPPVLQADPQFGYLMHGNPEFIYPTYLKNGRQKEKRYKCHKCPSAFEKREQYKVHLSLHGSKQRYKCELCDYSVKYYANYVQHMRKHQMNAEAQAERNKPVDTECDLRLTSIEDDDDGNIKLAIKTIPKYTAKSDFLQFSIGDQQTLRLLQRRRSSASSSKEVGKTEPTPEKEGGRKFHTCPYCPYSNQRRDSLENHMKRHKRVSGVQGNHECTHCDFSCNQSHYLRDHLKIHFTPHKNSQPKCFVHNDGVVLTIFKVDGEENPSEMNFTDCDKFEDACSKAADKIFFQPATGEIVV